VPIGQSRRRSSELNILRKSVSIANAGKAFLLLLAGFAPLYFIPSRCDVYAQSSGQARPAKGRITRVQFVEPLSLAKSASFTLEIEGENLAGMSKEVPVILLTPSGSQAAEGVRVKDFSEN